MLTWIILDPCKSIATLVSVAPSHLNISQCMKRQLVPWQVLPTFIATLAGKCSYSGPRYPSPVCQCDLRPLWNCPSRHKALATLPCATQLEFRSRQGLWNTQGLEPPLYEALISGWRRWRRFKLSRTMYRPAANIHQQHHLHGLDQLIFLRMRVLSVKKL